MKKNKFIIFGFVILFIEIGFLATNSVKASEIPTIIYQTHVQNIGWQNEVSNGEMSGTTGLAYRLEGIKIKIENSNYSGGIVYRTHVQNIGWTNFSSDGVMSGTTGLSYRLEAINIELTGELANHYDIYYQVHAENYGWLGWAKGGEYAGTAGFGYRLEGIKIILVEKGSQAPGTTNNSFIQKGPDVKYQTHVQNIGWQNEVSNGEMSGTTGLAYRLEGIKIKIENSNYSGGIVYRTHVQNIGWTNFSSDGVMSGTTGLSYRLEAINIELTGELANHYDIYYQVHAENYGWLGWAKGGEYAGTAGFGYRLEGIKIILVEKGSQAPGTTNNSYIEKRPEIKYQTHVQSIGWQNEVKDGEISGTTEYGYRLEGIKISLNSPLYDGSINYETYNTYNIWQNIKANGDISGSIGKNIGLQAIKMTLSGTIANYYDVYYQVHMSNIGWLGWAKNGEEAGAIALNTKIEAIRIKLVDKNGNAPGSTENAYIYDSSFVWFNNNGIRTLKNTSSGLIGTDVKKIIDVSEHQGIINWDKVKEQGDIDGVILRAGFGSFYEDGQFAYNIMALKRLNIPYGIYIFSYAENDSEATLEANGIINTINKYSLNPTLGVYYDIEDWSLGYVNSFNITKETYESMSNVFLTTIRNAGYTAGIYTGVSFASNRLSENTRTNITWIAQYNISCQYTGTYKMWQYSSSGTIPGINTKVDMNVWFN